MKNILLQIFCDLLFVLNSYRINMELRQMLLVIFEQC